MRRSLGSIAVLASLLIAACQSGTAGGGAAVEMVSGADQCGQNEATLLWVGVSADLPSGAGPIASASQPVLKRGDSILIVYLGQKPTPGYGAALRGAAVTGDRLQIDLEAQEPDPGAMLAQVITTPCVALRIPSDIDAGEVVVSMDADGFPLTHRIPD